jgi:hypothetical protein
MECINHVRTLSVIEYWKAYTDGNGHAETEQRNNIYAVLMIEWSMRWKALSAVNLDNLRYNPAHHDDLVRT